MKTLILYSLAVALGNVVRIGSAVTHADFS